VTLSRKIMRGSAFVPAGWALFPGLMRTQTTLEVPASGTWASVGSMAVARAGGGVSIAPDGRFLEHE